MSRIFGAVRQNGYVVRDIEAAMQHWTQTLGVGPFYYFERAPIDQFAFRGETSELEVSIALSNSGPLQIELIQQRNDAPSMYQEFLQAGHEGLQHVAYWSGDFDADLARAQAKGFVVCQQGAVGADGRFVYFENAGHPGAVVELSEISGAKGGFFEHIARLAADWDGEDPVRTTRSARAAAAER